MRSRPRSRRDRFRRHGLIRPTLPAGALVVVGGALGYLGLLLDDRALMAAVTMLAVLLIVDLVFALTQRFVPAIRGANGSSIARWFAPRAPETTPQWEQVDEEGRPVARGAGPTPERRGVYWHISVVVRWRTPFRLFAVRWVRAADGETVRLPEPPDMRASHGPAPDRRMAGQSHSDNAGGVRDYAPGDPPRLIAWRHSARLGELMTRETDRDTRPATLLVVDRAAAGGDPDRLDALIAAGMPYLIAAPDAASGRFAVIDGRGVREGLPAVRRYMAALQPVDGAGHDSVRGNGRGAGRAMDGGVGGAGTTGVETGDGNDTGLVIDEAVRYAARAHGPLRLVLLGDPHGGLAAALAHTPLADRLTVVEAVTPWPATVTPADAKTTKTELRERRLEAVAGADRQRIKPPLCPEGTVILARALSAAALLTFFGVALTALAGLVAPDGWWLWWFGSLLALAAIAAHIPSRAIRWRILRPLCFAVAALAGALILVILRVHDITGLWLTDMSDMADADRLDARGLAGFVSLDIDANTEAIRVCLASAGTGTGPAACSDDAWGLLSNVIARGFDALNLQLPPLKVDATADCFLILALTLAAIVIRFLLICRRAAVPMLALLPVAALAADYAFVGHTAPWWALAALACAFPISLWSAASDRGPASPSLGSPVALLASVLAAALTLALTPSALALAYRVPLSFGEGGGLLSTNTVNPMIDLKRSLDTGSSSTVLTYAADRRVYLRMSTLDDFDGETWNFDPTLARDGGFYGSGIQLGRNAEDEPTQRQRISSNPYAAYAYAERMERYGSGDAWYAGLPSVSDGLEAFSIQTDFEIATLRSRFLPVPGEGAYVEGVGDGWLSYGDGSVYNRTHGTSANMGYTAYATYLDPISSDAGFDQIDQIVDAGKELLDKRSHAPWPDASEAERSAARRTFAADATNADAGARLTDGMLLVPVEFESGGEISFAGQGIGRMRVTGSFTSSDGTAIPAGYFEFDDGFAETLLLGEKEPYAAAFGIPSVGGPGSDGSSAAMLAFAVYDDPIWVELNAEDAGGQAGAGFAGTLVRHLSDTLGGDGTWVGYMADSGDSGRSGISTVDVDRIRAAVERADESARRYRSLPKELPANVRAVIDQAKSAGISAEGNGHDQQVAAMRWLVDYFTDPANHFTYSLDAPDGDGRDNLAVLDDFLDPERGHAGYCAHYASALAVLGRALGVPTRLVLGYNKGTAPADSSGRYEVAARQLHSWVEAYIDGVGWMPFDVTPASVDNGSATATETNGDADDDDSPIVNGDASDAEKEDVGRIEDDTADTTDDDAEDETVERADAAKGKGAADTGASASVRLVWMWGALIGVALLLAVLALVPMLRRRLRRRARLAVIQRAIAEPDDAALADRAWLAAWAEIQDEAFRSGLIWPRRRSGADSGRDSGAGSGSGGQRGWCGWRLRRKLTWPSTATDLDIAELIAGRLETNAPLDAARVRAIARHAARAAFRPLHCSEDKPGLG